jgi:hypothetical protein
MPTNKKPADDKEKTDIQAATLVGDIRDQILALFKQHADWNTMKESKQSDVAESCKFIAEEVVRKTAQIVAGRGFKSLHCTLAQLVVKDGLKLVLTASKGAEGRHELLEHQGGSVTVVLTDINPYLGHRNEPSIDKDEPGMFDEEESDDE